MANGAEMKTYSLRRLLILSILSSVLALALAAPSASVGQARETFPWRSYLKIYPIEVAPVGQKPVVHVTLFNEGGRGLPNKPLVLYLDGEKVRRVRTDYNGEALIPVNLDLAAGDYEARVEFIGTQVYQATSTTRTLTVRPAVLTIETVPAYPGIIFSVDGRQYISQQDGLARIEFNKSGEYTVETIIPQAEGFGEDYEIKFERWGDESFEADRQVEIRDDKYLQAGFVLFYPVSQAFLDLNGDAVDESRITSLTLKSSFGARFTFEDGQYRLLQANRIARRKTGLEATPVQYSVESVMIDGTNVVNQYQQRFYVESKDIWPIELLLYYARVQAKDALLGFSIGNGVSLEYPNGKTQDFDFGNEGMITLGPLARGLYKLQVMGVGGMVPQTPVALSQDQEVELKVLTTLDISLGIAAGMLVALGLLFLGRPQLLKAPQNLAAAIRSPGRRRRALKGESS